MSGTVGSSITRLGKGHGRRNRTDDPREFCGRSGRALIVEVFERGLLAEAMIAGLEEANAALSEWLP